MASSLPLGKLPPALLARCLARIANLDPRVVLGPGVGLDCAVIDLGPKFLVAKTDPITFATDEIGWYAVTICSNDIATTGAVPRWFLAGLLLPEAQTTPELVQGIFDQIGNACQSLGVALVGGHSEITYDLRRPIVVGTMLGEVDSQDLITPAGARPGDVVLLTKAIPIEGTAIIAREKAAELAVKMDAALLDRARALLHSPGIGVLRDAQIACRAGGVTAMHDPTEGGLASGLWELADACSHGLQVDMEAIPIQPEGGLLCRLFGLDPLATIASGSLLMTCRPDRAQAILFALEREGIPTAVIGSVVEGSGVQGSKAGQAVPLPRPDRDEITKLFEQ